jgi:hypothetical protein
MLSAGHHGTAANTERGGSDQRTIKIRGLNDAFRKRLPRAGKTGRLNVTAGVAALAPERLAQLLLSVRTFSDFTPENDPHGEHDFGSIEQNETRYFWKIDAYDQWMQFGSPDPADPAVTTRVLTLMLASEY